MLKTVLSILRDSLGDVWNDIWTVLVCNLLWTLSLVLVIPGPAATLALFHYANRLAHGEAADLGDFWGAFRHNWGPAWKWAGLNLVVIALLAGDAALTGDFIAAGMAQFVQGFYLAVLVGWLALQLYTLSFLVEQEKPALRQALRNGAVMIGKNIAFTLLLVILLALLMAAGVLLFMLTFAFGGVIVALAANHAVIDRIAVSRDAAPAAAQGRGRDDLSM